MTEEDLRVPVTSDLVAAVAARRAELGLTLKDVTARGGPNQKVMQYLKEEGSLYPGSLAALEKALDWEPGSCLEVIRGGAATPKPSKAIDMDLIFVVRKPNGAEHQYRHMGCTSQADALALIRKLGVL